MPEDDALIHTAPLETSCPLHPSPIAQTATDDSSFPLSSQSRPSSVYVNGSLVLSQTIFGLGSVVAALGLPDCNPFAFALYREATAGLILLGAAQGSLLYNHHQQSQRRQDTMGRVGDTLEHANVLSRRLTLLEPIKTNTWRFFLLGLAIFANQAGSITGIKLAGPVAAAVWQPSQPIMTSCICMAMGYERFVFGRVGGVMLAFGGCVLMVYLDYRNNNLHHESSTDEEEESTGSSHPFTFLVGNTLFFINCLGTSLYVILSKRLLMLYPPLVVTAWSYSVAAICMALTTVFVSTSTSFMVLLCPECAGQWQIPAGALFALVYFILFNSCVAYAMITWANRYASGTLVMGYTVLQPVTAAILTLLLLGMGAVPTCNDVKNEKEACLDPPGWGSVAGMVGVFAGLYMMIATEPKPESEQIYEPVVVGDSECLSVENLSSLDMVDDSAER